MVQAEFKFYRKAVSTSATVNSDYKSELLGKCLKIPVPGPFPSPIKPESLGKEPGYHYYFSISMHEIHMKPGEGSIKKPKSCFGAIESETSVRDRIKLIIEEKTITKD